MPFDVQHRYCFADDVTECTLETEASGTITIAPSIDDESDADFYLNYADDDGTLVWEWLLSRHAIDQLVAELQRARSGCFDGEWPRPQPVVARLFDQDTADEDEHDDELERLLAEEQEIEDRTRAAKAEAEERLKRVTIDVDMATIRRMVQLGFTLTPTS